MKGNETMISEETVKKYCNGDISKMENYDKAITDMNKTWDCHHRLEIGSNGERMSIQDLKKRGLYYNRPVEELIFLTHSEHLRLHHVGDRNPLYGKHHSKDARMKISKANIGRILSEETRMKMSES